MNLYHMNKITRSILEDKAKLLEKIEETQDPLLHSKHGKILVVNTNSRYKGITPAFKIGLPLTIDYGTGTMTLPPITEINWEHEYFISDNIFYSFNFEPINLFKLLNNA